LIERWKSEGRWKAVHRFKHNTMMSLYRRGSGLPYGEAMDAAWQEAERNFPPMSAEEAANPVAPAAPALPLRPMMEQAQYDNRPIVVVIPQSWGELPSTAKLEVEVEWVHQNRLFCIEQHRNGPPKIMLSKARSPAPSAGAVSLMKTAAVADLKFMEILRQVSKDADGGDPELVRREKVSLVEIEEILTAMEVP
jgi:hypothetical protein